MRHILNSDWLQDVSPEHKKLIQISVDLYEREYAAADSQKKFADYSFVVFSMAKAYEGFLKQKFLEYKLIDVRMYEGRRFRIGRALNPDVREGSKDEQWLYDDVAKICGEQLARELWDTWLVCRNHVFHFFPKETNSITLETAGNYLLKISSAMKLLIECERENSLY